MKHFMRGYKQHISEKDGAHIFCHHLLPHKMCFGFREIPKSVQVDQTFKNTTWMPHLAHSPNLLYTFTDRTSHWMDGWMTKLWGWGGVTLRLLNTHSHNQLRFSVENKKVLAVQSCSSHRETAGGAYG